jgi:hypothetical protein
MAETETIEVIWKDKFGDTPVRINADEFDPAIHKRTDEPDSTSKTGKPAAPRHGTGKE